MIMNSVIQQPFSSKISGYGTLGSSNSPQLIIKKSGVESRARFFVLDKFTGRIIYRGISNADGTWEVVGLNTDRFFQVVTTDENGALNSASADWLKPQII